MDKREKILIIDDMESSRAELMTALGTEYLCFEAGTGEDGLDILQKESIDLILLGLFLPGMEFLDLIKTGDLFSQIPLIICTADEDERAEEVALRFGAEDYLVKPFKPAVVRRRVMNALRRRNLELRIKKYRVERETQKLMDKMPVGIITFEIGQKEMRPTSINKKAKEMFGFETGVSYTFRDKDTTFVELDRHDLNRIMSGGKEVLIDRVFRAHRVDGIPFTMRAIARMQPNQDGTMSCYAAVIEMPDED